MDWTAWDDLHANLIENNSDAWEHIWPDIVRDCIDPFIKRMRIRYPRFDGSFVNERVYTTIRSALRTWQLKRGTNLRAFLYGCIWRRLKNGLDEEYGPSRQAFFSARSVETTVHDGQQPITELLSGQDDFAEEVCDQTARRAVLRTVIERLSPAQQQTLFVMLMTSLTAHTAGQVCDRYRIPYKSYDNGLLGIKRRRENPPEWWDDLYAQLSA